MTFTVKQQRFIEAYNGNATEAAIKAGYSAKTAYAMGQRLLKNVETQKAIQSRESMVVRALIADREELQAFWTATMRDSSEAMPCRLKASELLGKSMGVFLERHAHTAHQGDLLPGVSNETLFYWAGVMEKGKIE